MQVVEPEIVQDGARRDTQGRRRVSAEERRSLVEELERSGLSVRVFAERQGVNYYTLIGWRARYRAQGLSNEGPLADEAPAFHETRLAELRAQEAGNLPTPRAPALPATSDRRPDSRRSPSPRADSPIEVTLPGAITVRCASVRQVAELVRLLNR